MGDSRSGMDSEVRSWRARHPRRSPKTSAAAGSGGLVPRTGRRPTARGRSLWRLPAGPAPRAAKLSGGASFASKGSGGCAGPRGARLARTARPHPWRQDRRCQPESRGPAGRRSRRRARQPAGPYRKGRAPERNDLAPEWKTLEADPLAHKTFQNRESLKATIDADIQAIDSSRKSQPLANQRISA